MNQDTSHLLDILVQAISNGVDPVLSQQLDGFALCTDDDVMSLFQVHHLTVSDGSASRGNEAFEFWEWPESLADPAFDEVSKAMSAWADQDVDASDARFSILVDALLICRERGVFSANTCLSVFSTDPDPHAQRLAINAIRRLNTADIASRFLSHVGWQQ